jgi:hypothetical protein
VFFSAVFSVASSVVSLVGFPDITLDFSVLYSVGRRQKKLEAGKAYINNLLILSLIGVSDGPSTRSPTTKARWIIDALILNAYGITGQNV